MLLFEYLIDEAEGETTINDSSGNSIDGALNPVRAGATPAVVSAENVPNGYRFKAIKYDVDAMPTSHGGSVEPDDQLQFLRVPIDTTIRNINTTRAFTISLWAYHEARSVSGNPWDGPTTAAGKDLFCPQHVCIDRSVYTFVRTKNLGGTVVPVADRGQLALTGPGDAGVVTAGGIGDDLGGTTSNSTHVPINEWIHLAFVLEAPSAAPPTDRGVWRCYMNGSSVGELPSTTELSAAGLESIRTEPSVDIRFGNFRGNVPAGNRFEPIAFGANDYAFHGYMTGFRMYDHALSGDDICAQIIADTTVVDQDNLNLSFADAVVGEPTARAAVFTVKSFKPVTLEVVGGAGGITVDPGAPAGTEFLLPLGDSVTVAPPGNGPAVSARIWVTYTGTALGDAPTGSFRVRVRETGEEFDFGITTNVIERPKVAAVLVLDKSNSMTFDAGNGNKRIDVLHDSAPPFPQLLPEGDAIGVAAFDHDPSTLMELQSVGPIGPFDTVRNDAARAIGDHEPNPRGNTAIGDGIERADTLLRTATATYNPDDFEAHATVVLTDGKETADKRIEDVEDLIETNNHIYAIGLGTAGNIEPAALSAIANGSGGYLMMTGVLDDDEQFKLAKFYLQIFAAITNRGIVTDPQGMLLPNQKKVIPFELNEADLSFDVVVLSPNPDLFHLTLETPAGDTIDPTGAAALATVTHSVGNGVVFYRVGLPLVVGGVGHRAGGWKAVLAIDEQRYRKNLSGLREQTHAAATHPSHGIPYNGSVLSLSGVRLRAGLEQTGNEPGATLHLRAELSQYDIPLGSDRVTVRAELVRPDGENSLLVLSETQEGVYTTDVPAPLPGIYELRVLAEGRSIGGRHFTREQLLTGAVWRGGDDPTSRPDDASSAIERCCRILVRLGLSFGIAVVLLLLLLVFLGRG